MAVSVPVVKAAGSLCALGPTTSPGGLSPAQGGEIPASVCTGSCVCPSGVVSSPQSHCPFLSRAFPSGPHQPCLLAWLAGPSRQLLRKQLPVGGKHPARCGYWSCRERASCDLASPGGNRSRASGPALGPGAEQRLTVPSTPLGHLTRSVYRPVPGLWQGDIWAGSPRTCPEPTRQQSALQ